MKRLTGAVESRKAVVLWNVKNDEIPLFFSGLLQIRCDKTAISLKRSALVAYPFLVVWLDLNAKHRKLSADYRHTLLCFFPVWSVEMKIEGGDPGLEKCVPRYGLTSSKVVPLETIISHTFSSSCWKERVNVLGWAILSLCGQRRKCTETGSGIKLKNTVWRYLPRVVSFSCDINEAKCMSFTRHGACRYHFSWDAHSVLRTWYMVQKDQIVYWRRKLKRKKSTKSGKDSRSGERTESKAGAWSRAERHTETAVAALFGSVTVITKSVEWWRWFCDGEPAFKNYVWAIARLSFRSV